MLRHLRLYTALTALLILAGATAFAQQRTPLKGIVKDSATNQPIVLASILSVLNGNTVISNKDGLYSVPVYEGTLLAIAADGYYTDTITVTAQMIQQDSLVVRLKPLTSALQDVVVTAGNYDAYQRDSVERRRHFLSTVGEKKVPTISKANDLGFGIALNLDHYSKTEKNKRQARSLFEILEESAYINHRWNREIVTRYTNFTGDQLIHFMQDYRPEYKWLRNHPDEDAILYYINSKLKKMKKIKED